MKKKSCKPPGIEPLNVSSPHQAESNGYKLPYSQEDDSQTYPKVEMAITTISQHGQD